MAEAEAFANEWKSKASSALKLVAFALNEGERNDAAFMLHQATERLYVCVLLVLTLYSPKSHRLNFLRSQAERLAPSLAAAWPRETRFEQRSFELLRRAYVEARYSPHYKISNEELTWLGERVSLLQSLVGETCDARLSDLRKTANN